MNYFYYCFSSVYAGTMWLYNIIFALVTILAFVAQRRYNINPAVKNGNYFLSFLIAWFFFVFGDIGIDLHVYMAIYEHSSLTTEYILADGLEIGFRLLIAALHSVIKNPYAGIGVLKTLQLALIYGCIYKLRDKISVGYAIMAYMAFYYFASFNIFRISLAGSLVLLSYVWLLEKRRIKSIILGAIACTIHNGTYVYAIALALYFCYLGVNRIRSLFRFAFLLAIPVVAFLGRNIIVSILQSGLFMERYAEYVTGKPTFGIMQIVFYLPLFYILIKDSKNVNKEYDEVNLIFTLTGFAVALVGYSVGMLARVSILFSGPFLFYVPKYIKQRTATHRVPTRFALISMMMVVYWILRYILSIEGYFITSGLYPFQFVF